MKSCVLDLPEAIEHARELARGENITDVVEHRAGNLLTSSFGTDNDVVLLSNILHHFEPEVIPGILTRVVDSLSPGGTVAIWDVQTPDSAAKPGHADAFALFCWAVSTSACFTGEQYSGWLRNAGLCDVKITCPLSTPGQALIAGQKVL